MAEVMIPDSFMERLERGLLQYFRGDPTVDIERQKEEIGDVIAFKVEGSEDRLYWASLKLYCRMTNKGRVVVAASFPRHPGVGYYCWPSLKFCSFSPDTSLSDKAIAARVIREIVEPAKEPMVQYLKLIERQQMEEESLPSVIAKYREMGFVVHPPRSPGETLVNFYFSGSDNSISVRGTLQANGCVTIARAYLDAEKGEALMRFIQEIA